MDKLEERTVNRESLLLLANLRVDGQETAHRVRVRNLSTGGMMAESDAAVTRGSRVAIELNHLGWVEGTVAWKQHSRFGIAFIDRIDLAKVREPVGKAGKSDEVRRYSPIPRPGPDLTKLRKI